MLGGELDNNGFSLVGECLGELGSTGVELGILAGLDSLVPLLVSVELSGGELEGSVVLLVLGLDPTILPRGV